MMRLSLLMAPDDGPGERVQCGAEWVKCTQRHGQGCPLPIGNTTGIEIHLGLWFDHQVADVLASLAPAIQRSAYVKGEALDVERPEQRRLHKG